MSDVARDEVVRRIRAALTDQADERPVPRSYRVDSDLEADARIALFIDRLVDYRALVRTASTEALADTISSALHERGVRDVLVPDGLPAPWLSRVAGVAFHADSRSVALAIDELDRCHAAVTGSTVAIAQTGTIVLTGRPAEGRRVLSLIPDYHLCIVAADDIVATVPEAVARLAPTAPQTWISGPSATSDIELHRVEGVHGPRTLEVVIVA